MISVACFQSTFPNRPAPLRLACLNLPAEQALFPRAVAVVAEKGTLSAKGLAPQSRGGTMPSASVIVSLIQLRRWHKKAIPRGRYAGFDIIYVCATHDYLLSNFFLATLISAATTMAVPWKTEPG